MNSSTHISQQYDNELEGLRSKVLSMGGLVEQHLSKVIDTLASCDFEAAAEVAVSDYKVNALEVEIDHICSTILLTRAPAASDLRLVLSVFKTINDLERIGDETEKIAKLVLNLRTPEAINIYYAGILTMAKAVRTMMHDSLNAFARTDSAAALKIAQSDKEIDDGLNVVMRQLITYTLENTKVISSVLDATLAARALERIGDHNKNICENIIYLVEGIDIRNTTPEQ